MSMTGADSGRTLATISPEYSTMSPFNSDNTRLLLLHLSYFGLYDGAGNFLKDLPLEINASSQPRWSRKDPNILYYVRGNQLKQYNVGTNQISVVRAFSEYTSVSGNGESDISFDGARMVLVGNGRYVFVYDLVNGAKGPVFDSGGRSFDSVYITPNDNVTITWNSAGSGRFQGIELFDRNMNFLRQVARAGGHMDVTRDANGDEVLVWINAADPAPICNNGIVKIRLADGRQTCLASLDWSMAVHISAPDNAGWVMVETYAPRDPMPTNGWTRYTNELLQIKLDGSEIRRIAHHRSRPFNSYTYQPKVSVSCDGSKLVFGSNYGLQAQVGYPQEYSDAYLIDLAVNSPGAGGGSSGGGSSGGGSSGGAGGSGGSGSGGAGGSSGGTTPAVTRYEQTNGVAFTGAWYDNNSAVHSGSSAKGAMDAGARATFSFTGSSVSWIAYRDEWSGIARVYVDGALKGSIDAYASPFQARTVLYSVNNLTSGPHTLVIEATGTASGQSRGRWIWVDAFDVGSAAAGAPPSSGGRTYRVEQNGGVHYSGAWFNNSNIVHSGGSARLAMDAGARASFTFTGNKVSWIGLRDEWSGIARVYIDGALKGEVDGYSAVTQTKTTLFTSDVAWGRHTITIEAAGRRSGSSRGNWIWIDAFEYFGDPTGSAATFNSRATTQVSGGASLVSPGQGEPLQINYSAVKAQSGAVNPAALAVLAFRQNGVTVSEAGFSGAEMTTKGRIHAEISGPISTGFAIINPNEAEAEVEFSFVDSSGAERGSGILTLPPHGHLARFLHESPFDAPDPFIGAFTFTSSTPVSAIALRGLVNERSEFLVTTLPIVNPDAPRRSSLFFPHFADGGGWTTQFVLTNPTDETISGRLDFLSPGIPGQAAGALALKVDGAVQSSVSYTIPPRSSKRFQTADGPPNVRVGSAKITPDGAHPAPAGVAIFSFRERGVTVSEAGTPALAPGVRFRSYAELNRRTKVRTGLAVVNTSENPQTVRLELLRLDGTSAGVSGSIELPAFGQRALFLDEIAGFQSLPEVFRGVVRVASQSGGTIAVLSLRSRVNERNEFLVTTTNPVDEAQQAAAQLFFPHLVDGGGYSTQLIMFRGSDDQAPAAAVDTYAPETPIAWAAEP